jgi:SAM-dependent methyltransferase
VSSEPPVLHGLARVRQLWTLFRNEQTDPEPFYAVLAREAAADLERRYGPMRGKVVADLGCGPGFYTRAFRAAGATVLPVDNSRAELELAGDPPEGAILADAGDLPFDDASVDGVFCSALLEHTPNTPDVIREIERILKPSGWGYISWTNWYSPWGGHDMTPYQYLGPSRGPRLYEKRHGPPRKNPYGDGLWPVHVGPTIRLVRSRPGLVVERIEPRYWPRLAFITRVPGLREVATWNCVIRVRKATSATAASTQTDGSAANRKRVVP